MPVNLVWNWKTAALSVVGRIFFYAVGAHFREPAALQLFVAELLLATALGGFQGAVLQRLKDLTPVWRANLLSVAVFSLALHPAELFLRALLHHGTSTRVAISFAYTIVCTLATLHLMRRGLLLTGPKNEARPPVSDSAPNGLEALPDHP